MFNGASRFNNGSTSNVDNQLTFTNTSSVTDMSNMFNGATNFNNGISGNVGRGPLSFTTSTALTNINGMFKGAVNFNQHITFTDTSHVTDMSNMFNGASIFNNDTQGFQIGSSVVTNMSYMFANISYANLYLMKITTFDTTSVTDMSYMFYNSIHFTNNATSLNFITNNVINMNYMFAGIDSSNITQFNQNFNLSATYWGKNSNLSYINFNQYGSINPDANLPTWMSKNW